MSIDIQEFSRLKERLHEVEVELFRVREVAEIVGPHGRSHELAGGDTMRLSVQSGGLQLNRQRTLNAGSGLTATEDQVNRRINLAASPPTVTVADVTTGETTTSTSYTDLATAGPSITMSTPAAPHLVIVSAQMQVSSGATALMSPSLAGAAAVDADAAQTQNTLQAVLGRPARAGTAGTHTAKYRVTAGGTGTFLNRRIIGIGVG